MRRRGAKHFFFKPEGSANALPKVGQAIIDANNIDLGLRLYCIRLTDDLVILLNGSNKTHQNPILCPNVGKYFRQAQMIATKIDKAVIRKEINLQNPYPFQDFEIEI